MTEAQQWLLIEQRKMLINGFSPFEIFMILGNYISSPEMPLDKKNELAIKSYAGVNYHENHIED